MAGLIDRFRAGDADAVREVYRQYAGPVLTVARSIVRDPELAADVVQQTFVRAWRSAERFDGDRDLAPWLYSIARNTAVDALRSELKPTRGGHDAEVDVGVEGPTLEQAWESFEVRRAVDGLPPHEREVVYRSHVLGYTHEQIAEQLAIPIGTVKSRSGRAHRRLHDALAHVVANYADQPDVLHTEEPR